MIPVCPEMLGGLPTPRSQCEIVNGRVLGRDGTDYTEQFEKGAGLVLALAERFGCGAAILKDRSPSCGCGTIYDGSFSGILVEGNGVAAEMLLRNGIRVINESKAEGFLNCL